MFKNLRIGTKMLVIILFISLSVLLAISAISYTEMLNLTTYSQNANIKLGKTSAIESQKALLSQAENYLQRIASEQASNINGILTQISDNLITAKDYVENLYINSDSFVGHEIPLPEQTEKGIISAKYTLAPGVKRTKYIDKELNILSSAEHILSAVLDNNSNLDNIYIGTKDGISYRYSSSNFHSRDYDPRNWPWYTKAMENNGNTIFLETYIDSSGTAKVTCAVAFNNQKGKRHGVIATDLTLDTIRDMVINNKIGENGYSSIIDKKSSFVFHPSYKKRGFNYNLLEYATEEIKPLLKKMAEGKSGIEVAKVYHEDVYIAYTHLPITNWTLTVLVPVSEILQPALATSKKIDTFTLEAQNYIHETLSQVIMHVIILFSFCAIVLIFFAFIFSKSLTRPINELVHGVKEIGTGNLDHNIEIRSNDEIGQLAKSFNSMTHDLKDYIDNLSAVIKEKEHISSELNVAASIQNDMLPSIYPTFSNIEYLKLYAKMMPAKEIGGDYYDIFFVDEEETKLCCLVADVSGKGIPASLFMVIAKTILKTNLSGYCAAIPILQSSPDEKIEYKIDEFNNDILMQDPMTYHITNAINKANNLLEQGNNSCMFVTVFTMIIDMMTGEMEYINCGHNPPLLRRKNMDFKCLKIKGSLPLAVMPNTVYNSEKVTLEQGDIIYMYTDGITEAMNIDNDIYGDERLLSCLNSIDLINDPTKNNPEYIDNFVRQDVNFFVNGAAQSDDITSLVLIYTNNKVLFTSDKHE